MVLLFSILPKRVLQIKESSQKYTFWRLVLVQTYLAKELWRQVVYDSLNQRKESANTWLNVFSSNPRRRRKYQSRIQRQNLVPRQANNNYEQPKRSDLLVDGGRTQCILAWLLLEERHQCLRLELKRIRWVPSEYLLASLDSTPIKGRCWKDFAVLS